MAQNYKDLVSIVEDVERTAAKVEFNTIDISSIKPEAQERPKPQFSEMLNTAIHMEEWHMGAEPVPQRQKQIARAAVQHGALAQATVQVERTNTPEQDVKEEVGSFASNLKVPEEALAAQENAFKVKVRGENDLVLPTLSPGDQISEIERVIEGLQEHVFNEEQLDIVRKELYGLRAAISKEGSGMAPNTSAIEESLLQLRDRRLVEAITLLGESK
ncbi:MAG: hypothetical protein ACREBH_00660 [Candidatus Micrarchaeaceae archaeon]